MKNKIAFLLWGIGLVLLASCSSDDIDPKEQESSVVLELSTFTNTGSDFVQMDLNTEDQVPALISLRETFDLEFLESTRLQFNTKSLAFFTWEDQLSRVYYSDLVTGTTFTESDFCGFDSQSGTPRFIQGIWGDLPYLVMAYVETPNGTNLAQRIRIFNRSTGQCIDLDIVDASQRGIRDVQMQEDVLVLLYESLGTDLPVIRLVDLNSGTPITSINLDDEFLAATTNETDLFVFGRNQTLRTVSLQSLTVGPEVRLPDFPILQPGLFQTRFSGETILVSLTYQQPSLFFAQPSLYDLSSGGFSAGGEEFLALLQARIENDTGDRFLFGDFDADPDSGRIAISYIKGDGSPDGGLVICDFQGNPLQIIPLPVLPDRVVIRSVRYR